MRIVLDMAWGAAAGLADRVFAETGAEVIGLHSRPDGDRINVNCGSTHLAPLKAAVREYQADVGFAFDGDADRVMAVDAQGRVVDGDYILYLWGKKPSARWGNCLTMQLFPQLWRTLALSGLGNN